MDVLRTFATNHPVICALSLTLTCFVSVLFLTGIASSKLRKPYGEAIATMMRLAVTAGLLLLIWRLGGLEGSGIARLGRWQVWLLAVGGMFYFAGAGLYAFYGKVGFDVSSFGRLPAARTVVLTQFVSVSQEEILFRGVMLYVLFCA
jgi:hypothetical protein